MNNNNNQNMSDFSNNGSNYFSKKALESTSSTIAEPSGSTDTNKNNNKPISNERKELKEINNRLGFYINAVRELTQHIKNNQSAAQMPFNNTTNQYYSSSTNNNFLMRNFEKDIDQMKQLYEEELRLMRMEIEELSILKNKYSLDNFNLELKLKDFIVKFEDIKKTNEELTQELSEAKTKANRIEFEFENSKLETEKPWRENKQLRKDLEDLLNKLNEKQAISDNEIAYRQDLETKYKELTDSVQFERKLHEQQCENYKSQLDLAQQTINQLESKLNESLNRDVDIDDVLNQLREENQTLRDENNQLNERNESLKHMCKNLEAIIKNLESMKNSLEDKITQIEMEQAKLKSISINSEINSIKTKLDAEEIRLLQLTKQTANMSNIIPQAVVSRFSFGSNIEDSPPISTANTNNPLNDLLNEEQNNSIYLSTQRSGNVVVNRNNSLARKFQTGSFGSLLPPAKSSNDQQQLSARLLNGSTHIQSKPQVVSNEDFDILPKQFVTPNYFHSNSIIQVNNQANVSSTIPSVPSSAAAVPPTAPVANQSILSRNKSLDGSARREYLEQKDYTNDLFNNFEKNTLFNNFKRDMSNNSTVSTIDNAITDASYIGNVKIHEVNKNGYFIRLLNVSNTIDEDLSNYSIQQMVATMPVAVFRLPQGTKLPPGHTITIWARTDEVEQQPPHTFVWQEQDKWGFGPECTTILAKPNGQAVSWTTGCHKYGNIDYDEVVPVYSQKRNKQTVQLNRQKLIPQTIFTPTKHPHGASSINSRLNTDSAREPLNTTLASPKGVVDTSLTSNTSSSAFQRSFFQNQKSRPVKSAIKRAQSSRPQTSMSMSSPARNESSHSEALNDDDIIYQENLCFVPPKSAHPQSASSAVSQQTLFMNKIK